MRQPSLSRNELKLSASTPSLSQHILSAAAKGGMQRAYRKFQFYERDQLSVQKYFGGMRQLKKLQTDMRLSQDTHQQSSSSTLELFSRTFHQPTQKTSTHKVKDPRGLSQAFKESPIVQQARQHINIPLPLVEIGAGDSLEVEENQTEQDARIDLPQLYETCGQDKGPTQAYQRLGANSGGSIKSAVLADTNFVSPRLSSRLNANSQQHKADSSQAGGKRLLTLGLSRANYLRTNKQHSSSSSVLQNHYSNSTLQKKEAAMQRGQMVSDWKLAINDFKKKQLEKVKEGIPHIQRTRTQSTKVAFNPPKKIRDILLDPRDVQLESQILQHEALLQKYGTQSANLLQYQNPEAVYRLTHSSVFWPANQGQEPFSYSQLRSPFRSKDHVQSSEAANNPNMNGKSGGFRELISTQNLDSYADQRQAIGVDGVELYEDTTQGTIELTLPAIIANPSSVQRANFASFQITRSRVEERALRHSTQQSSTATLLPNQTPIYYFAKDGSSSHRNMITGEREILLQDETYYQPAEGEPTEGEGQFIVHHSNQDSMREQNTRRRQVEGLKRETPKVIGKLHFEELLLNRDGEANDKPKLLRKIQEQIKKRLNKYKSGADMPWLDLSPSKKQTDHSQTLGLNSSKELRRIFNSQALTKEGPYQNRCLNTRHNSLKKLLRERGNPSKGGNNNGAAAQTAFKGILGAAQRSLDDKEFTQAIDEMINMSKTLETLQQLEQPSQLQKNSPKKQTSEQSPGSSLSKVLEDNRRSPKRQPSQSIEFSQQQSQRNLFSDIAKDGSNLDHKEQAQRKSLQEQKQSEDQLKQESQQYLKSLTSGFEQQLLEQEFEALFQIFQKSPQERSMAEEERIIDYLFQVSIFTDFPKNLVKEMAKKFMTLTLKAEEIIKYKSDDSYQIVLQGEIMKLDPRENFSRQRVLNHSLFDPSEHLTNSAVLVVQQQASVLAISKKEFAKSIKIASLRQGKEDDTQFLARCEFFSKLEKETLNRVCRMTVPRLIEEGKKVYDIGDVSEEMFIVRSGSLVEQVVVQNPQAMGGTHEGAFEGAMQISLFQNNSVVSENATGADEKLFQFATFKTGDWFGQSEMMIGTTRKSRVVATQSTLLLCIRKYELEQAMSEEYFELLRMHIFDHQDLHRRMIQVSTASAQEQGVLRKYKHFQEQD